MNQPKATVRKLVPVETFFVNIEETNKQGKVEEVSYLAFYNPKSPEHKLTLAKVTKLELSVAKPHITDQFMLEKLSLQGTFSNFSSNASSDSSPRSSSTKPTLPRKGNTGSVSKLKEVLSKVQTPELQLSSGTPHSQESAKTETPAQEQSPKERSAQERSEETPTPKRGRPKKVNVSAVDELDDATS